MDRIELRIPEGYAFYGLYPEAYLEAARKLALVAPPKVIGIRSIGTSLGAIVAATLGAPAPVTVRPFGDPFRREIALAPAAERALLAGDAHYVIVDEGPGLSGSSFGAVADWLQQRGVPVERIAFMPSHRGGLGPQASPAHRQRWNVAQVAAGDFGTALPELMSPWLGELDGPMVEISGGGWRRHALQDEQEWPAVHSMWERRKFLARSDGRRFLVKFAGLGAIGERKLGMARALHAAGLTPEPMRLVHGYLVESWCGDALPLPGGEKPIAELARYIGTRARLFPAGDDTGASPRLLHEMVARNLSLSLGPDAAQQLGGWRARLQDLERRVVRVRTDNKLDRHEWLRTAGGRLLKTDALDHHCAHDLIGCQDMAWDVAGAICEFELDPDEARALAKLTEQAAGRVVDPEVLGFCRITYPAFRLGQVGLALDGAAGDVAEVDRLARAKQRYLAELQHLLPSARASTRQESWVG